MRFTALGRIKLDANAGEEIGKYILRAIRVAEASGCSVDCEHNSRKFTVLPTHAEQVAHMFDKLYPPKADY